MTRSILSSDYQKPASIFQPIIYAGLLAGVLDGAAASINYFISTGNNPTKVFQYVASAIFGREAFSGGLTMVAWGLLFHFLVAIAFAGLFFLVYPTLFKLLKNKIVMGIVYGLVVWLIMDFVIVPLTRAPAIPFTPKGALIGLLIHIFMVGIPISLIIHRFYTTQKS